jgi:putative SOS response-associated peptidase YedK
MCGRYTFATPPGVVENRFNVKITDTLQPTFNAAPTQLLPVILNTDNRELAYLSWGLIPSWAKSASIASKMINARAETLHEKPSFKNALVKRRCLVLADGFYEWAKEGKKTYPVRVSLKSGEPYSMAGLWEQWIDPQSRQVHRSFTIITTSANELLAPIHERMPVFLTRETEEMWLDNSLTTEEHCALLNTYPSELLQLQRVSKAVNSINNNSADVLMKDSDTKSPDSDSQITLF